MNFRFLISPSSTSYQLRKFIKIDERHFGDFWTRLLRWMDGQKNFVYLTSNNFGLNGYQPKYKNMAAIGEVSCVTGSGEDDFEALKTFLDENSDWTFGYFSYDLKNQIEQLTSDNDDYVGMSLLHFFVPSLLFLEDEKGLRLGYETNIYNEENIIFILDEIKTVGLDAPVYPTLEIKTKVGREAYLEAIRKINEHIQYGDIYEVNYCIEHYAEQADIDPVSVYLKLNENNPAPFSNFCKWDGRYLISASPERFMRKIDNQVISQPMKGTAKRGKDDAEDAELKKQLLESEKERAENVMIVDLVRNDLSRTAKPKSVEVEELFGVYTFPQVHQLISTVKSEIKEGIHAVDVIKNAFPMGSMTGAPKVRAMELIEKYEATRRGLFSGSVGYFTPEGDFDFNVIIRSILFNSENKYLSFITGGAITINSDPEKEYEECQLKAKALKQALS